MKKTEVLVVALGSFIGVLLAKITMEELGLDPMTLLIGVIVLLLLLNISTKK